MGGDDWCDFGAWFCALVSEVPVAVLTALPSLNLTFIFRSWLSQIPDLQILTEKSVGTNEVAACTRPPLSKPPPKGAWYLQKIRHAPI